MYLQAYPSVVVTDTLSLVAPLSLEGGVDRVVLYDLVAVAMLGEDGQSHVFDKSGAPLVSYPETLRQGRRVQARPALLLAYAARPHFVPLLRQHSAALIGPCCLGNPEGDVALDRLPLGLSNPRASCYFNSALQMLGSCLVYLRLLREFPAVLPCGGSLRDHEEERRRQKYVVSCTNFLGLLSEGRGGVGGAAIDATGMLEFVSGRFSAQSEDDVFTLWTTLVDSVLPRAPFSVELEMGSLLDAMVGHPNLVMSVVQKYILGTYFAARRNLICTECEDSTEFTGAAILVEAAFTISSSAHQRCVSDATSPTWSNLVRVSLLSGDSVEAVCPGCKKPSAVFSRCLQFREPLNVPSMVTIVLGRGEWNQAARAIERVRILLPAVGPASDGMPPSAYTCNCFC